MSPPKGERAAGYRGSEGGKEEGADPALARRSATREEGRGRAGRAQGERRGSARRFPRGRQGGSGLARASGFGWGRPGPAVRERCAGALCWGDAGLPGAVSSRRLAALGFSEGSQTVIFLERRL